MIVLLIISVVFLSLNAQSTDGQAIAKKLSEQYGFSNWGNIKKLSYDFNVDRPNRKFSRSWIWDTKTDTVVAIKYDSVGNAKNTRYHSKNFDKSNEELKKIDGGFINDQYWMLFAFHLNWDTGLSFKLLADKDFNGKKYHVLEAMYNKIDGYTPGDAYEIYYDDSFTINAWAYRPQGGEKVSILCSWEDQKLIGGITIPHTFRDAKTGFHLFFTNVKIEQ